MRTIAPRLTEKKSVYCGKRHALLRKGNGDFAVFLVKITQKMQINAWIFFLFEAERKEFLLAKAKEA